LGAAAVHSHGYSIIGKTMTVLDDRVVSMDRARHDVVKQCDFAVIEVEGGRYANDLATVRGVVSETDGGFHVISL
jgi:hypothetical protein